MTNKVIDFQRARRSRKMTADLLGLDQASRVVLYAAAQPFLTDSDRDKIHASTNLFNALAIAEAMLVKEIESEK